MATRFEKKNTDKTEIKKEEKKVNIGKALATGATMLVGGFCLSLTKANLAIRKHKGELIR